MFIKMYKGNLDHVTYWIILHSSQVKTSPKQSIPHSNSDHYGVVYHLDYHLKYSTMPLVVL